MTRYQKEFKILFWLVGLVVIAFVFYVYSYQKVINASVALEDEHCLVVNPLIIQRKVAYMDSMKILLASGSAEDYWQKLNEYKDLSDKYAAAEKAWLVKDQAFRNRLDFRLTVSDYIKQAAEKEYEQREADLKTSQYMSMLFDEKDPVKQKLLEIKIQEEVKNSNNAGAEYEKLWEIYLGKFSLKDLLTAIPPTQCPAENFDIPDVNSIFEKKEQSLPSLPVG